MEYTEIQAAIERMWRHLEMEFGLEHKAVRWEDKGRIGVLGRTVTMARREVLDFAADGFLEYRSVRKVWFDAGYTLLPSLDPLEELWKLTVHEFAHVLTHVMWEAEEPVAPHGKEYKKTLALAIARFPWAQARLVAQNAAVDVRWAVETERGALTQTLTFPSYTAAVPLLTSLCCLSTTPYTLTPADARTLRAEYAA